MMVPYERASDRTERTDPPAAAYPLAAHPPAWRHSCEDCGRGVGPPETVCPLCQNVRNIGERLDRLGLELAAGFAALAEELAALRAAAKPGAIAVPVLSGQIKLR